METSSLARDLNEQIRQLPVVDVHTHMVGGNLGAKGLHDIVLYHMAVSDLYSAGCPSGSRLTQYPGWPTREEAHSRLREALPYLGCVRNTSISWGVRIILRDLYGVTEDVTEDNWERLDSLVRERAADPNWGRDVIAKAGIRRVGTEIARRSEGEDDDLLDYSLEWGFFTRTQWGEFDTALYELERCWGELPGPPAPIGAAGRPATTRTIRTLEDVNEALDWYVSHIPIDKVLSTATHLSTDIDYRQVDEAQMRGALSKRDSAGPDERDTYASYINEAFLTQLEQKLGDRIVYQFSFGAEPLPFETGSRLSQRTIAQLARIISLHPGLRFQCFLSSRHANQSLCTLCRELPNLSLSGYWWHNFFPGTIRQVIEERLDMLPVSKQIGFFSDAYCAEWAYGKIELVRAQLARVLAEKVEMGQFGTEDAVETARQILWETPKALLRMH